VPTLIVQQGHCYRTTGSTGTTGEQDFATKVAQEAVTRLHGHGGWSVAPILADAPGSHYVGDAFVAIHCDGSTNPDAHGASVGYQTWQGQEFGAAFKQAYQARGWSGFRTDNYTDALAGYYGVSNAVARGTYRSIIIESGFMTNPADRAVLTAADGPARVALAVGDALGISHEQQQTRKGRPDMTPIVLAPRTQEDPGRIALAVPKVGEAGGQISAIKVHSHVGWFNALHYKVWCVAEGGGYTNANKVLPYEYVTHSDQPGYFYVPGNTAGISIEYWTELDTSEASLTVEYFYA